jgi:hypothetical protein
MPLASTFLDEETMDGCIRKAVEWCKGLPSHDATHVKKMELSETIRMFNHVMSLIDRVCI